MNEQKRTNLNKPLVGLFLLLSICTTNIQSAAQQVGIEKESSYIADALYSKIHEIFVDLLEKIDAIFDTIGHAYTHGAIGKGLSKQQKESIENMLFQLRKQVSLIKANAAFYKSPVETIQIMHDITQLTDILDLIASKGVHGLVNMTHIPTKHRSITINESNFDTITPKQLNKLTAELDKELTQIAKKSENLGLSRTNKAYRATRRAWKKYYISEIAERVAVYGSMGIWITYITGKSVIKNLADKAPIFSPWLELKKLTGGPKISGNPVLYASDLPVFIKTENGSLAALPQSNMIAVIDHKDIKDGKVDLSNATPVLVNDLDTIPDASKALRINHQTAAENGGRSGGDGYGNKVAEAFDKVVKIGAEGLVHLTLLKTYSSYILNDAKILKGKLDRALGVVDDKLYGSVKQRTFTEILVGTDLTFKDIIGRGQIKSELEKIIDYVCNPAKYDRNGVTVEKGFLFVGPSQNGKSVMVKAFANELTNALARAGKANQVRLVTISIKEIIAAGGISPFVAMAESFGTPVILAIDEIDMLCLQRDRDSKMLADVLTAMSSGLSSSEKNMVIIIGLTNKPTNIDFALRQHGRFGKVFWFDKPTYQDRLQFFEKECERCFLDTNNFDCQKLAHETEGSSFGTLLAVSKRAFFTAKQSGIAVTQKHFEDAVDTEVKNIVYTNQQSLSPEKERVVAVHQAGKALVSMLLDPQRKLCKVTVLPYTTELEEEHVHQNYNWEKSAVNKKPEQRVIKYGGIFSYSYEDELLGQAQEDITKEAKITLAGNIAQNIVSLDRHVTDKEDQEKAFAAALTIESKGNSDSLRNMPKRVREEFLTNAYETMKKYEKEVTQLLIENKKALEKIADALIKYKELDRSEVEAIIKNSK